MRRSNTITAMMKEYISDSLLLLMTKKAYNDITIAEITKKAGVNRTTYYRNFDSKNDIIKYYFKKIILEFRESIINEVSFSDYLFIMFSNFYKYKKQLLCIYKNGVSYLILEALNETFTNLCNVTSFEEQFRWYYHTGGIYNTFLLWFSNDMKQTPEYMSKKTIEILPNWVNPELLSSLKSGYNNI